MVSSIRLASGEGFCKQKCRSLLRWNAQNLRTIDLLSRLYVTALIFGLLLLCKVIWFGLMAPPAAGQSSAEVQVDLAMRRAYLLQRVANKDFGVDDMPSIVASPYRQELAIATLSMSTVALTNLSFMDPAALVANRNAVRTMLATVLKSELRRYDVLWWGEDAMESLGGAAGHAGYLGHVNLMLGCFFLLGGEDASLRELHHRMSATLARRLEQSGSYYIESFPGRTYTADNVIVIYSLRLRDQVVEPEYADLVRRWLAYSKQHLLDPQTGMLRYHVSRSGQGAGTARGVLQAWNSMWLPFIDEEFARDQYGKMSRQLLARNGYANFSAIREYADGQTGPTDLVSGPLVLGLSPTATGFAMGGASFWNDRATLAGLLRTAEVAGFSWSSGGRRRYLLAPLLGDAIILAARTMTRWDNRFLVQQSGQ